MGGLKVVPVAVIYVLAMAMLALHLWHGVWSMTQTLGLDQARYRSPARRFATAFTIVVCLGFAVDPAGGPGRVSSSKKEGSPWN